MALTELQERYGAALDDGLNLVLSALPADLPELSTMVRYPLGLTDEHGVPLAGAGGKRIRPILLLLCHTAAGGNWQQALPAAVAVELLHNFSLVHDDIQDDSFFRRGRATVWRLWGRSQAINVGDLLFALAFASLQDLRRTGFPPELCLAAGKTLVASCLELTRGQHLDMRFECRESVSLDSYMSMIHGKSAALLATCAQIGALLAGAAGATVKQYARFGRNLGVAFQIRDDILGIWGDEGATGKSTATDLASRKKTLPVLYGLEHSEEFKRAYAKPPAAREDVQIFVTLLEDLGALEFARSRETRWARAAEEALTAARPAGAAGDSLRALVSELLQRTR